MRREAELRILVLGRSGQLARCLSDAGASACHPDVAITAVGRPEVDLRAPDTLRRACDRVRPHVLVNAAAYTAVDQAETDEADAFAINAEGAENAAHAARSFGCPVVHVSTDYVFDGSRTRAYVEDDDVAPLNVYGRSKLDGEERVASACDRHVIVRTSWVHSAYGANFVKTMLRLAETRDLLRVVDDQRGAPTYAPHLADAIIAISRAVAGRDASGPWGVTHVAGYGETTWCGLAREVFLHSARHGGPSAEVEGIPTSMYPTTARRPVNSRLDCTRLKDVFNYAMPSWREGAAACVNRLLRHDSPVRPQAVSREREGAPV